MTKFAIEGDAGTFINILRGQRETALDSLAAAQTKVAMLENKLAAAIAEMSAVKSELAAFKTALRAN